MNKILPFQMKFDKKIPAAVNGCAEYFHDREMFKNIDDFLQKSGLDNQAAAYFLQEAKKDKARAALSKQSLPKKLTQKEMIKAQTQGVTALRAAVLRNLTGNTYREMGTQLALVDLYQWFCKINRFLCPEIPGKSLLNYLENRLGTTFLKEAHKKSMEYTMSNSGPDKVIPVQKTITTEHCFFDPFCLEANIHYPVDWVLLRDASRTLMLLIQRIRKHVVNRMDTSVEKLMTQMNRLCIEMTESKGKKDAKKKRKKVYRKMKKLVTKIAFHGRRHIEKLYNNRAIVSLSEESIIKMLNEMNAILLQLPKAIEQGHQRIISENPVKNSEKLLSLYEDEVNVIVRNKAGKKVEFGNKVSFMEQEDGLIVDWDMIKVGSPGDHQLCKISFDNVLEIFGKIKSLTTDRGCHSKANSKYFESCDAYDATCPKGVEAMTEKRKDDFFCKLQKRRSSTEARISILKNFTGGKLACKSFAHREQRLALSILTHNLWKVSEMEIEYRKEQEVSLLKTA